MKRRLHVGLTAAVLLTFFRFPVFAQSDGSCGVPYRLDVQSTYKTGCFAPCMCPIVESTALYGTFRLVPGVGDPLFQHYGVTQVDWQVVLPGGTIRAVMGSGDFKLGGEVAIQEQLTLDLAVGADPVQRFDSGLVVPGVPFPLLDLTISLHGGFCADTLFRVRARPIPRVTMDRDAVRWDADPPATQYDVVQGDLGALRANHGNFRLATSECLASGWPSESIAFGSAPAPGAGFWLLVRDRGGSYDAWDVALAASRDAAIDGAPASCP